MILAFSYELQSAKKTFCIYGLDTLLFISMLIGINAVPYSIESYLDFIKAGLFLTPVVLGVYLLALSSFFSDEKRIMKSLLKKVIAIKVRAG